MARYCQRTVFSETMGSVPLSELASQLDGRDARRAMFEAALLTHEERNMRPLRATEFGNSADPFPVECDARMRAQLNSAMSRSETYAEFKASLPDLASCMTDVALWAMAPGLIPRTTEPVVPPKRDSDTEAASDVDYGRRTLTENEAAALTAFASFDAMAAALEDEGAACDSPDEDDTGDAATVLMGLCGGVEKKIASVLSGLVDADSEDFPLAYGTPTGRMREAAGPGARMALVDNYVATDEDTAPDGAGRIAGSGSGDGSNGGACDGGRGVSGALFSTSAAVVALPVEVGVDEVVPFHE